MPLQSDKNLYPGVNAHLNSFLQSKGGGWKVFHSEHIIDITRTLRRQLPENYLVLTEDSLQISQVNVIGEKSRSTTPDVMIYQTHPSVSSVSPAGVADAPVLSIPLSPELDAEIDYFTSVVIYQAEGGVGRGEPITRIELLSPVNKPGHSFLSHYMAKRYETLRSGVSVVEIDYLHELPPILSRLPTYADGSKNTFPYYILVSNPAPNVDHTDVYGFNVDDRMPKINIPLVGKEVTLVDFGAIYNQTYENIDLPRIGVDYAVEPERMNSYTPTDQERIRQRMKTIHDSLNA